MRFYCDYRRAGIEFRTDNRQQAENWLREQMSEGAIVTDHETGEKGRILASGEIVWSNEPPSVRPIFVPTMFIPSEDRPRKPAIRQTHTYAVLAVSKAAYDEIHGKLLAAGYTHCFDGPIIDMQGIGLEQEL